MPNPKSPFKRVRRTFDRASLKTICEMHETEFEDAFGMVKTQVNQPGPENFYLHLDRGSDILAVAHLDTVMPHEKRTANYIDTAGGPVIYSGALDDRLGAYTILDLLPNLDINVDVLLTVGEEQGMSTADFFEPTKEYNWMIEFDRGGTDVVAYQYEDQQLVDLVADSGARMGMGSFSDIAFLEHLERKGLNWGVGYRDYHGPRSHAYLEDYWMMLGRFLKFHDANAGTCLPHERQAWGRGRASSWWAEVEECAAWCGVVEDGDVVFDAHGLCPDCSAGLDGETVAVDDDPVSDDFNLVNERLAAEHVVDRMFG